MLVVLIVIQFIRPVPIKSGQALPTDISNTYNIPENVNALLKNACYDCHSNNSAYPWYANIQPIAWLIAHDIKEAKEKYNFSEFGLLSRRKQISRLQEMENSIKDETMPLLLFKWMHKSARLTNEDKKLLIEWVEKTKDSLENTN